jgi:hypothetical protein
MWENETRCFIAVGAIDYTVSADIHEIGTPRKQMHL